MDSTKKKTLTFASVLLSNGATLNLEADFYAPNSTTDDSPSAAIVFFHGGALTTYSKDHYPSWLLKAAQERNAYFISANYRLLIPSSLFDILEDVKSLFGYIQQHAPFIDPHRIIVSGSSAGALLASLAVMHVHTIKPIGYLSLMGLGGQHFTPERMVKSDRCFYFDCVEFDKDLLTQENLNFYFQTFRPDLAWHTNQIPVQSCSPTALWQNRPTSLFASRHPRSFIMRVWQSFRDGKERSEFLDILLGRKVQLSQITDSDRSLFPMLSSDKQLRQWPPALFLHGDEDQIVLPEDSVALANEISKHHPANHVQVEIIKGGQHDADHPSAAWDGAIRRTEAWLDAVWLQRPETRDSSSWRNPLRAVINGCWSNKAA